MSYSDDTLKFNLNVSTLSSGSKIHDFSSATIFLLQDSRRRGHQPVEGVQIRKFFRFSAKLYKIKERKRVGCAWLWRTLFDLPLILETPQPPLLPPHLWIHYGLLMINGYLCF